MTNLKRNNLKIITQARNNLKKNNSEKENSENDKKERLKREYLKTDNPEQETYKK